MKLVGFWDPSKGPKPLEGYCHQKTRDKVPRPSAGEGSRFIAQSLERFANSNAKSNRVLICHHHA